MSYEGQLKSTYAEAHHRLMTGKPIPQTTLHLKLVPKPKRKLSTQFVSLRYLIDLVADQEKIPAAVLKGDERNKITIRARHIFCWLARNAGYGMPMIGRFLGGRDHTTVLSAIRSIESKRQTDHYLQGKLDDYAVVIPVIPKIITCANCPYAGHK